MTLNLIGKLFNHLDILNQFKLTTLQNSFVDEIFYYNKQNDFVLSNEYGYISNSAFKYSKDIEYIMNSNQDANWMHLPLSSKEGYISLARKLPIVHSGNTQGLLVIQVKMEPFQDYFPSQKYQSSFILDKNNSILMRDKESAKDGQVNSDSALQRIIESDSSSGAFYEENRNGNHALYNYDRSSTLGRVYISIIPKYAISEQMNLFRWITFSIIVFLSIGVLLTIFNTRNAYKPIKQLMNYSQSLRNGEVLPNNDSEINIIKNSMHYLSMEKWRLGNFINQVEPTLREWFFQQVLEGKTVLINPFIENVEITTYRFIAIMF